MRLAESGKIESDTDNQRQIYYAGFKIIHALKKYTF